MTSNLPFDCSSCTISPENTCRLLSGLMSSMMGLSFQLAIIRTTDGREVVCNLHLVWCSVIFFLPSLTATRLCGHSSRRWPVSLSIFP